MLTRPSIARVSVSAPIDVDAVDGVLDEIQLDAVDDDALDASAERGVTSGGLGDAGEVVAAADEERLVESELSEGAWGIADDL